MSLKKKSKRLSNDLYDVVNEHSVKVPPEIILYAMAMEMINFSLAAAADNPHTALNEAFGAMQIAAGDKGFALQFQVPTTH